MVDQPSAALSDTVDALLEATVAGSFSSTGIAVRRRLARWAPYDRLDGRVVVLTGGTSGIGAAAVVELARLGATVHLVGRDRSRAEAVRDRAEAAAPGTTTFTLADLGDPADVRRLAASLADRYGRIDVLIHNAGALSTTYRRAPDGTESTVAVQVLAPFLLTGLLRHRLGTDGDAGPSRVLTVTSGGMYGQRFDLDRLEQSEPDYHGVTAYARAKRAQVVLTGEWSRRAPVTEVAAHAMHPGWVDTPGLGSGLPGFHRLMGPLLRTPAQGADTLVWLAGCADAVRSGGDLWLDRRRRSPYHLPWTWTPPARRIADGADLWAWCEGHADWAP